VLGLESAALEGKTGRTGRFGAGFHWEVLKMMSGRMRHRTGRERVGAGITVKAG
jgi:hypothetical protein